MKKLLCSDTRQFYFINNRIRNKLIIMYETRFRLPAGVTDTGIVKFITDSSKCVEVIIEPIPDVSDVKIYYLRGSKQSIISEINRYFTKVHVDTFNPSFKDGKLWFNRDLNSNYINSLLGVDVNVLKSAVESFGVKEFREVLSLLNKDLQKYVASKGIYSHYVKHEFLRIMSIQFNTKCLDILIRG